MTRRRILAAMFSLALVASIPGVLAQTEVQVGEGGAGLEDLIGSFFNGEQIKGTFVAAPPDEPHNPYGDPVVLSDEFLAGIDLGISINLVINPNPFPILRDLDFDGQFNDVGPGVRLDGDPTTLGGPGDQILGDPFDADRDNILDKDQNDTADPYDDAVIPPSHLMGGHETLEGVAIELAAPTLRAAPAGSGLSRHPSVQRASRRPV